LAIQSGNQCHHIRRIFGIHCVKMPPVASFNSSSKVDFITWFSITCVAKMCHINAASIIYINIKCWSTSRLIQTNILLTSIINIAESCKIWDEEGTAVSWNVLLRFIKITAICAEDDLRLVAILAGTPNTIISFLVILFDQVTTILPHSDYESVK